MIQVSSFTKQPDPQTHKTNIWFPKGKRWEEEINEEFGTKIHTALYRLSMWH